MSAARYDPVAQSLHRIVVALVAVQFTPGVTEDGLDRWHLAIGPRSS